jgi:hypothetical protein
MNIVVKAVARDWWWPVAWEIWHVEGEKFLIVRESPSNPHACGEKTEVWIEGVGYVALWENETAEPLTLEEVRNFLHSLDGDMDIEVMYPEDLPESPLGRLLMDCMPRQAWSSRYEFRYLSR